MSRNGCRLNSVELKGGRVRESRKNWTVIFDRCRVSKDKTKIKKALKQEKVKKKKKEKVALKESPPPPPSIEKKQDSFLER